MKDTWDNLFIELDNFAPDMKEFFEVVPQSPAMNKYIKNLQKRWKQIQKHVNSFEKEFNPAKPIIIRIPEEFNHIDFLNAWQEWKEYLAEQHSIIMLTRMEKNALEMLLDLSEKNKDEAIYMLRYASHAGYPKFFKVNKNTINNQTPPKDGKIKDPDLD